MAVGDGSVEGDTLCACAYRVRGILNIGSRDKGAELGQDNGTDPEIAVGTVGGLLGGNGVAFQVVHLLYCKPVLDARGLEVQGVDAGEEGWGLGSHGGRCLVRFKHWEQVRNDQGKVGEDDAVPRLLKLYLFFSNKVLAAYKLLAARAVGC